jgi:hypothetical protein
VQAGEGLAVIGLTGAALANRSRPATALAGLALLASSALTRFGVFMAGKASARDPAYTVGPQRERVAAAELAAGDDLAAVPVSAR